jgi:citrate lyase subunit beta / citryl-CoA lyase
MSAAPLPRPPELRRTWLFDPGANRAAHEAMLASGADLLIFDLEDFTPPPRRPEARGLLATLVASCRERRIVSAVRINALEGEGRADLEAALAAGPDVIAYPMAESAAQMRALDAAIGEWESHGRGGDARSTSGASGARGAGGAREASGDARPQVEILPVCETALGVVDVRAIAAASPRIRCALLGAEDLANDLQAERGADAVELDHARRRFVLECRAARIEPVDAPYTFSDVEGAVRETSYARRLGYRCKSLVLPAHAAALNAALTPSAADVARAKATVAAFEAARARGEERALFEGLWVEVPTYRNARRLIDRAGRLAQR